jgi:hypothetical protein
MLSLRRISFSTIVFLLLLVVSSEPAGAHSHTTLATPQGHAEAIKIAVGNQFL